MGGVAALARITRLQKRVWVEAHEHVTGRRTIPKKMFLYPVETWHASGLDSHDKRPVPIQVSFDPDRPNAEYQVYNPARTLEKYGRLIASVWHSWPLLPDETMELRRRGRKTRWHFLDRYLGEGVGLEYLGREQLQRDPARKITGRARVDVVEVRDYEFGTYLQASFDVETGLLVATREGLNPAEEEWYQPALPGRTPGLDHGVRRLPAGAGRPDAPPDGGLRRLAAQGRAEARDRGKRGYPRPPALNRRPRGAGSCRFNRPSRGARNPARPASRSSAGCAGARCSASPRSGARSTGSWRGFPLTSATWASVRGVAEEVDGVLMAARPAPERPRGARTR